MVAQVLRRSLKEFYLGAENRVSKGEAMNIVKKVKRLWTFQGLEFFRCQLCSTVVSVWNIRDNHGCPKCAGVRIMPTKLSVWENLVQLWKHPDVWNWPDAEL